ncbi:MAG TPA: hypothetical protein VNQ78_07025 [Paracoccus sp. (in: a-proteobacteria)]|uniref:hypothetical protein n=1 Tax=Paracoccus sp. TaxID=267 RepID=UPI002BE90BD4|nr:hypothetical protein [Paracoccus sp. (in: a-proteobacteria)]HWL56418.1 hypothetical protein [Paracoccus sp. (in: a-proteobacteria)]
MELQKRLRANNPAMPTGVEDRLALVAAQSGLTPPDLILVDCGDGDSFSDEFLTFCGQSGFVLDWVWIGEGPQTRAEAFRIQQAEMRAAA